MKYCHKCGAELKKEDNFCRECGEDITKKKEIEFFTIDEIKLIKEQKEEKKSNIKSIFSWIVGVIAFFVGRSFPIPTLIIAISSILGSWIANTYMNSNQKIKNRIRYLMYSNFITWILPVAGFLTSSATLTMSSRIKNEQIKRNWLIIGGITFLMSLINSIVGYIQAL